jgi:hypothetical protein
VRLTFIGKDPDSNPTGSPTVYRTDRETWIVQAGGLPTRCPRADGHSWWRDRCTVIRLCRSSFEAVWKLSIPHREYAPV